MRTITNCRVCESRKLKTFFDLGKHPLANSLLKTPDQKERFNPLSLSWCANCHLVQINQTVDPKELFSKYVWVTGTAKTTLGYAQEFCNRVLKQLKSHNNGLALEVGSNDGTFLAPFKKKGLQVLGVDPAQNIVKIANSNSIPTKCAFFGEKFAKKILNERGPASIVIARNVLAHVADTRGFVQGLETILDEQGLLVIEVHYAKVILEELHYDAIYHEHICYFTLKNLEKLLNDFGLYIFDIEESPISGGSIVVYAKKYKGDESSELKNYRKKEEKDGTNTSESWENFAKRAMRHRRKLLNILNKAKEKGTVVGYGASARSSTLLNFCGIDSKTISAIADANPLKHNLFTAGTHIPVASPEVVMKLKPKFVVILAWNFADEIMEILKSRFNYNGECIIPLPNMPRKTRI